MRVTFKFLHCSGGVWPNPYHPELDRATISYEVVRNVVDDGLSIEIDALQENESVGLGPFRQRLVNGG
jgi:hypothetical protein